MFLLSGLGREFWFFLRESIVYLKKDNVFMSFRRWGSQILELEWVESGEETVM